MHVLRQDGPWGRVLEYSLLDHDTGAAGSLLLSGLEDQLDGAGKVCPQGPKDTGRTQQAGRVDVMAAGVHHTLVLGAVCTVVLLPDVQGIDIGPQGHHRAGPLPAFDQGYHPRFRKGVLMGDLPFPQAGRNVAGRFVLGERQLRVLVQMPPEAYHLRVDRPGQLMYLRFHLG